MDPWACSAQAQFHRSLKAPSSKASQNHLECTAIYVYAIASFLFLITFHSLSIQKTISSSSLQTQAPPQKSLRPKTSELLSFHPLKDPTIPPYKHPNKTWFMSTLTGHPSNGMPEHFVFPSRHPNNKILCVNRHRKAYAFASGEDTLPLNTTILGGLTFVADSFYDYENPWHGLNAISGFFAWMKEKGCEKPSRFLVFKNGEVVKKVGRWVFNVMKAGLGGGKVVIESLEGREGVVCFEKAVVMRRGLGAMSGEKRHGLFEMLRCKAWRYCNVTARERQGDEVLRISIVAREGKRAFRNESGVKDVMQRECDKVNGCRLRLIHLHNMSFCNQVNTMHDTDVLATTHGAQLTNMMFMPKGSSVMEMFPTGWLQGAGIGQFIYQWFASWSEMRYEGAWRDTSGFNCSTTLLDEKSTCFSKQKDQQVGIDDTYLAAWTRNVIANQIHFRGRTAGSMNSPSPENNLKPCSCDE